MDVKVGRTYKDNFGNLVTIVCCYVDGGYPYFGDDGKGYRETGEWIDNSNVAEFYLTEVINEVV